MVPNEEEFIKEKSSHIGDGIHIEASSLDGAVSNLPRSNGHLKAAGILQKYAKGKPDFDAEQKAVEDAITEKYSKI